MGRTWPNPAVGCVIVRDGIIVGRGHTADGGRPHAETRALEQAGAAARGATAYVTLEPCSHHGQTPPCADALIAAGVKRVVAAITDNDPRVNGQGFDRLRAAGLEVTTGILADEAADDLAGFFLRNDEGRPWVTLKLAQSFDGRIATATGDSKWITGDTARRAVHAMRARHDAVMVGGGTARADDPMLNIRDIGVDRQPIRVVLSRKLDLPLTSRLAASAAEIPLWLCHGHDADANLINTWQSIGARTFACTVRGGVIDPASALTALGAAGLTSIFCEGGGALAAALLRADLVDELISFSAGVVIGGDGRASIGNMGHTHLAAAPRYRLHKTAQIGNDTVTHWRRA